MTLTHTLTRRDFLKLMAVSSVALPAWMPRLAFAPQGVAPNSDLLVCIFLRGGLDGLSAVVPMFDADYYRARPTLAVPEATPGSDTAALDLDGRFGLHPALRPLLDPWQAGHLAIVHAAGSPDPTRSHFDAMDFMERGTPGEKTLSTGWIGRHLQLAPWQNDSPFRAVGMGGVQAASLRGPVPVTTLQSIADFHLQGSTADLATIQTTLAGLYSLDATVGPAALAAFDAIDLLQNRVNVADYTSANGAAYPEGDFGLGLKQIAQLHRAEVGLEVACVDLGGFDTHANQNGGGRYALPELLAEFAAGLGAFYTDLRDQMSRISVVVMSEFGRRVDENASAGTDHGHGGVLFALGGELNGGQVVGRWPGLAPEQRDGPGDLAITTDYRDVLAELVGQRLGNTANLAQIFPGYTPTLPGIFRARG